MASKTETIREQISVANIALESLVDDVMEPDEQDFHISKRIEGGQYTVSWDWKCYSNSKSFPLDESLEANVKAYCFDLIIMTRNL